MSNALYKIGGNDSADNKIWKIVLNDEGNEYQPIIQQTTLKINKID